MLISFTLFISCDGTIEESSASNITLKWNNGTEETTTVVVEEGSTMPAAYVDKDRTGYTFLGVYDALTGGTQYYYSSLASAKDWDKAEDSTLYGRWEANQYAVTLSNVSDPNVNIEVTYDSEMPSKDKDGVDLEAPDDGVAGELFNGYWNGTKQYYDYEMNSLGTWDLDSDTTLTAGWEVAKVITYDSDGGTAIADGYALAGYPIHDGAPADPTKDYYTFDGWSLANTPFDFTSTIDADITLDAGWDAIDYDINYNLAGGENDANNPSSYNIETANIVLANPTKDYYTFDKWYSEDTFVTPVTTIPTGSHGTVDLYAQWIPTVYNITYNLNSGTNDALNPNTYTTEDAIDLEDATQVNFVFDGWYTDATLTNKIDEISAGSYGDITLYAGWAGVEYTVSFNNQGGNATDDVTATYNEEMPTAVMPVSANYTFLGYFDASSGGNQYYNADMSSAKKWLLTTDTTLYAQWTPTKYSVTFNENGGDGGPVDLVEKAVTSSLLPVLTDAGNIPTKVGSTFLGYYDQMSGGTMYYTDALAPTSIWYGTSDITLYAHWN